VTDGSDFSLAQNRPTSIQASHPIEFSSDAIEGVRLCCAELYDMKSSCEPFELVLTLQRRFPDAYSSLVGLQLSQRLLGIPESIAFRES
jgi:hypothetical protein